MPSSSAGFAERMTAQSRTGDWEVRGPAALTAARPGSAISIVHPIPNKLIAGHWLTSWMGDHDMLHVTLVVRRAQHRAHGARDACQPQYERPHNHLSGFAGTRVGRLSSKILKILLYSSVHDDGRTNAWSSTG